MKVKLISLTQSLVEGVLTAEELLVYIARVSNPSNQLNTETSDKLIGYMIKNKHWSPFDMINMTVEVTTSKAVSIQILRHWSIKPQEFSQRYAEVVDIEPIELRKQGATNRQVGDEIFDPVIELEDYFCGLIPDLSEHKASELVSSYLEQSKDFYKKLLSAGVAKECARMVLPMATSTTLYLNGSVRSWIHYMEQRTSQHAQKEHRDVAVLIEAIFKEQFPMTSKALGLV
ncbi:MAG: FAD-dependent thymidylate synthase [Saprospiraceae bacterium]|nr:FAD-dependent thymidylate synthase [Saprospiraceae bacterium]